MNNTHLPFDQILESHLGLFFQNDSDYEYFATSLKPAKVIKQEHVNQIKEFFKLSELQTEFDKATALILNLIPDPKIKEEFANCETHFLESLESIGDTGNKPLILQEMFGFSDETLIKIYTFVTQLIEKSNFKDAFTLLVFLTTLAPFVPSYWLAEGICLQELKRHAEAVEVFNGVKLLNAKDPAPIAYLIESYLALNEQDKAKEELNQLKQMMPGYEAADKNRWENSITYYGGIL